MPAGTSIISSGINSTPEKASILIEEHTRMHVCQTLAVSDTMHDDLISLRLLPG